MSQITQSQEFADLLKARQATLPIYFKNKDRLPIHSNPELGIHVFIYTFSNNRILMIGFYNKRIKSNFNYNFANEAEALKFRNQWENNIHRNTIAKKERQIKEKAERAAGHQLTVGDVLMACWGWEQTNIDYYQVTHLIGKQTVELRKIASEQQETGYLQGNCVPRKDHFIGDPMIRRIQPGANGMNSARIDDVRHAEKIEPIKMGDTEVFKPVNWSSYA